MNEDFSNPYITILQFKIKITNQNLNSTKFY